MKKSILAFTFSILAISAMAQTTPVDGEITKINEAESKITLRHGPIKNLNMDGMTMVFAVTDPDILKSVKTGDKVRFEADRINGRLTVTKIIRVK